MSQTVFLNRNQAARLAILIFALLVSLSQRPAGAQTTAPPAGTSIGNQAAASYTDGSGVTRNVTSNQVATIVQQVAAVDITADNTKSATAGSPVNFPHTIINLGNGTDRFNIVVANLSTDGPLDLTNIQIFPDANGDGVADSNVPLTDTNGDGIPDTGPLTAPDASTPGQSFKFVVTGTLPSGATLGQNAQITVTARSVFNNTVTDVNTDRVNVTTNANINSTLAISQPSGPPGTGPLTYTVTLTNTGNTPATNVTVVNGADGIPAGMTYIPGSGTINGVAVTDAAGAESGLPAGTTYTVTAPDTITTVIPTIAAGGSVIITYRVNVDPNIAPQVIPETQFVSYFNGAIQVTDAPSSTANFTVTQVAGVVAVNDNTPTPGSPVPQGATVTYTVPIINAGNATDTFNITVPSNNFPPGTTFQLFQSDGVTPLQDTNGDGIPDTGPVVAGDAQLGGTDTYPVVVRVILPPGANSTNTPPPAGGYTGTIVATSVSDPTKSDPATITLAAITPSTVNLTNLNGTGAGTGPEATPQLIVTANPGTTAQFPLVINNTSAAPDSFNLGLAPTSPPLPPGATLTFYRRNPDGTLGAPITNTGTLAANDGAAGGPDLITVVAVITLPAGAIPAQSTDLIFRAISPTTGATDSLRDRLVVATIRALDVAPSTQTGQAFPGNFALYTHTITNNGNVTEGNGGAGGSDVALTITNSAEGFTSVIYWDANNNGVLDATDPVVTNLSQISSPGPFNSADRALDPGETATFFVKTFAPSGAPLGTTNTTTLTAAATNITNTGTPPTDSATDTTTVISSNLQLTKAQALDATCNGVPDTAYTSANVTTGAIPGACIRYRIIVTNTGTAPALNVVVSDSTPAFTLYNPGAGTTSATGAAAWAPSNAAGTPTGAFTAATTAPAAGGTGALSWTIGTLNPGQSASVFFGVRIRP